jgi:anthranilate phosphoribosyltransferase
MEFRSILNRVLEGMPLNQEEAYLLASNLVKGELQEALIAGTLIAMKVRGERPDEVVGFARAMRESMIKVSAPGNTLDTAGTGGDSHNTLNVSTAVAMLISHLVPVAKHGNRAVSSSSGSADVLEALGYIVDVEPNEAVSLLSKVGFAFLFAQKYHPAMKNVAPVRRALGVKTIFNLLGPLTNPASVGRQVIGVYSMRAMELLAHAASDLGYERALLVHGEPGLDEVSPCCVTNVVEVNGGRIESYSISPEELGVSPISVDKVRVVGNKQSAIRILRGLAGLDNEARQFIKINAALALYVAGVASSPKDGAELAEQCFNGSVDRVQRIVESHGDVRKFEEVKRLAFA